VAGRCPRPFYRKKWTVVKQLKESSKVDFSWQFDFGLGKKVNTISAACFDAKQGKPIAQQGKGYSLIPFFLASRFFLLLLTTYLK
jgi:hypothetical protein